MPFPRRGRRRPFLNSRWQIRRVEVLCLFLAPTVRSTLTAWMKIYGETNNLPGLASGPIEVRFRRLREHTGADTFLLWTTPESWSAGEAISFWIPAMGLALECRVDNGRLLVQKARPTTDEERDPRRQRSAVGMELRPERIELPPPDQEDVENPSSGLIAAFERLLDRRWTSFVDPLREALEAEARDDTTRAEKLATPYAVATPRIGGQSESDPYRLSGIEASAVAAFDEGEWLDLVDARGRVISSARLVRSDPAEGTLDVDVRGADPPSEGIVRPRPQTQILAQKRAILDELDNPTGGLANAVKLVASPASLPPPSKRRPAAFVNRLVGQNRSQVRAVSLALGLDEGQAMMVQGPPGTGKSTTLAEILGQLVLRDPNVTVLVCSHSNHGVDNLLMKTLPYLETVPNLAIARVGLYDRVNPAARPHFVPPGEDLGAFNVVFTTVDALALQVEAGGRTYDYAVLDEANRASILDSLIPLVRGRRFILVGDHLQLQPVLSEAEEQLRLEPAVAGNTSAIGKSLFAWLRDRRFPEAATIFLDEQNRMHPVIAGLISEVFYEGKLRSGRRAPRRVADVPLFPAPVTWVDTRGLHGLREARGRGASLVNVPEARLVATIARHILSSARGDIETGVISAYAEQTALLRRLLLQRNQRQHAVGQTSGPNGADGAAKNGVTKNGALTRDALRHLEIDTVDAFEGREKDVIIVSLVRSNRRRDIGFLRLMQRINVALSRARTMLIIVGDTSTLRGSYFDRIVRYVRANGMLVPGPRLIGRLLNARSPERHPERPGDRAAALGRRRRPLPSPRTAFPEQDPAAAARPAAGEDTGGGRNRRRRRRVRGRPDAGPGADRHGVPPTINLGMTPASEPGPDEPATQAEIDRFAALVEQLLGDGGMDNESNDAVTESTMPAEPRPVDATAADDRSGADRRPDDRAVGDGRPERGPFDRTGPGQRRRRGSRRGPPGHGQDRPAPEGVPRDRMAPGGPAIRRDQGGPRPWPPRAPFGSPEGAPAPRPIQRPENAPAAAQFERPAPERPALPGIAARTDEQPTARTDEIAAVPSIAAESATIEPVARPRRTRRRVVAEVVDAASTAAGPGSIPAPDAGTTPQAQPARPAVAPDPMRPAAITAAPESAPTVRPVAEPTAVPVDEVPAGPARRTRRPAAALAPETPAVSAPAPVEPVAAPTESAERPAAALARQAPARGATVEISREEAMRRVRRRVTTPKASRALPDVSSESSAPTAAKPGPTVDTPAAAPAPRRTRRSPAATAAPDASMIEAPATAAPSTPSVQPPLTLAPAPERPALTPASERPALTPAPERPALAPAPEPAPRAEPQSTPTADAAPPSAPARRRATRTRVAAPTSTEQPSLAIPLPAPVTADVVPVPATPPRRTRRTVPASTSAPEAVVPPSPLAPAPRRRRATAVTAAPVEAAAPAVDGSTPASGEVAAPKARRTRRTTTAASSGAPDAAPVPPEAPAPARPRRTRRVAAATSSETPAES